MNNKILIAVLAAILLACSFFISDRMEQNILDPEVQSTITTETTISTYTAA